MPNVWTHFIFGQHCLKAIGEEQFISNSEQLRMFNMGCQGPDFLFYHNFLPWKSDKTMNLVGDAMHSTHCGSAIMDLLEAVDGCSPDAAPSDPSLIYALGFVLHHLLDRHMHPYVFSRSGFRKWDHQRFEVMMDTLIVRKLLGIETWKTEVWREINNRGELPDKIVDAFEQIVAVHYPELAPRVRREAWSNALLDMIRAQRLFYDPTGIKRLLTFGKIEPFVYKCHMPQLDILNEAQNTWMDPTDGKGKRSESVWNMWDSAMIEAQTVMKAILQWLRAQHKLNNGPYSDEEFHRIAQLREAVAVLIGDRSYETGLPCDSGAKILHADPIWSDMKKAK